MTGDNTEPTEEQLYRARMLGRTFARAEIALGNKAPSAEPQDEEDVRWLTQRITGEKIDPDTEYAQLLATAFEDGYYDTWEAPSE